MQREDFEGVRVKLHRCAEHVAFRYYLRHGRVPGVATQLVKATASLENLSKFNPYHVPAGMPDGGQFTFGPGGSNGGGDSSTGINDFLPDVTDPGYREPGLGHPPVVEALSGLAAFETRTAARIIAGIASTVGTSIRINRAVKSIEDYLGGRPDRTFRNKAGDMIIMRGNKKIRFDINNHFPDKNPHFQIEIEDANRNWVSVGRQHRYYFREGGKGK